MEGQTNGLCIAGFIVSLLGHVGDCRSLTEKGLTKNHHNKKALELQSSNAFLLFGVTIYFLTSSSPFAFTSTVTFWPGRTSPAMMALASMVSRWLCM